MDPALVIPLCQEREMTFASLDTPRDVTSLRAALGKIFSMMTPEHHWPITGGFPSQRANDAEIWCLLNVSLQKLENKQLGYWWYEMLWRPYDAVIRHRVHSYRHIQIISYELGCKQACKIEHESSIYIRKWIQRTCLSSCFALSKYTRVNLGDLFMVTLERNYHQQKLSLPRQH